MSTTDLIRKLWSRKVRALVRDGRLQLWPFEAVEDLVPLLKQRKPELIAVDVKDAPPCPAGVGDTVTLPYIDLHTSESIGMKPHTVREVWWQPGRLCWRAAVQPVGGLPYETRCINLLT